MGARDAPKGLANGRVPGIERLLGDPMRPGDGRDPAAQRGQGVAEARGGEIGAHDLRTVVLDVPSQDVISRDNVSVKVNAVVYFRVVDAEKAVIQMENFLQATSQLAQTTLRSVAGKHTMDEMLCQRDKLNADIQEILDQHTEAWGVKVTNVEIKQVDLDHSMIRAMARQAEAERTRRAKIINADGEQQAAQ